MRATFQIAWRFMLKGTEKGAFSPMTLFAWLAIGVGVAAMGCLLSVMYGFEGALRDRVLTAFPHIMVKAKDPNALIRGYEDMTPRFQKIKGIDRVLPFLESEMILRSDSRTLGGVIRGIRNEDLESLKAGITDGKLPNINSKLPQVLVGQELAKRLSLSPGDHLKVLSPLKKSGAMGMAPESETFEVSGLYASGHYEFDQQYLFMSVEDAQDLMKVSNGITGWNIWAKSPDAADRAETEIMAMLRPEWKAESWKVFNSALFHSLKLEQFSMSLILNFAILIAVMNIVITLIMHVTHKRKNIGILRAIGASKKQIAQIFIYQGALIGGVGLVLGAVLTCLFVIYIRHFSTFQLPEIYYDRTIPIELRPLSFVVIYAFAIVMIYLATIYPAKKAANLDPIEAIRE